MAESLAQLYTRHPFDSDEKYWRSSVSLEDAVHAAGDVHLQPDPIDYLETIREDDSSCSSAITEALLSLPPEVVIEQLGEEIALWASLSNSVMGDDEKINSALAKMRGITIEDLEIAQGWSWRKDGFDRDPKRVLAQYGLMQSMKDGVVDRVDLPAILENSARPGITLSNSRIDDYALTPIETDTYNWYYDGGHVKGWGVDTERSISISSWLDTPTGFALTYKGVPNAMAGLAMNGLNEIMLHQIQGIQIDRVDLTKSVYSEEHYVGKISSRGLMPLDWQKVLVQINEHIAELLDKNNTAIQSAANNVWIHKRFPKDTEPHLPYEKAINAYDVPAERLGYTRAVDGQKNWHKHL
jgi:hypothetical protein